MFERSVKDIFLEKAIGVPQSLPIGLPGIGERFPVALPGFPLQENVVFLTTISFPRENEKDLLEACPTVVAVCNIEGRV